MKKIVKTMKKRDELLGKLVRRFGFENDQVICFARLCELHTNKEEWTQYLEILYEGIVTECEKWNF